MLNVEYRVQDHQSEFAQYIKLIGKGQKAGTYLTQEQAYQAMSLLLTNQVSPEQQGAFLMLLRMREESAEELAGFVQACRKTLAFTDLNDAHVDIDLGCYAGKRRHLPWFVLAVMLLAQHGHKIFLHGTAEPDSERLYLNQVWQAFDWPIAEHQGQVQQLINLFGFCYMDLSTLHPAMDEKIQLRRLFGLRSCFNSLARMLNPSQAKVSIQGVFHRDFDEKHIKVASLLGDHVACFRGEGGEVEANPEREFQLHLCQGGSQRRIAFPECLAQRQIKPRTLNTDLLINVWLGKERNLYSEQAVITTVAVMLATLNDLSAEESLLAAQSMWNARDKVWPNYSKAFL